MFLVSTFDSPFLLGGTVFCYAWLVCATFISHLFNSRVATTQLTNENISTTPVVYNKNKAFLKLFKTLPIKTKT